MLISLNWLAEYVDLPELATLVDRLTMAGSEVERISEQRVDFEGVVVAQVESLRPHPNANKLQLAVVSAGGTSVEVVTGARNIAVGDRVPLALTGARLQARRIESQVLRGIRSEGMLCSAIELGLGDDAEGILILDTGAAVGEDLRRLYPPDTILELEIKSNRPDLLCHLGVAREVGAIFNVAVRDPLVKEERELGSADLVRIEAHDACRRFVARRLTSVRVAPSPPWMQARLRAAGVRPISNVVDVTNYVMLEMGQPMHAFDYQRLAGGRLVVRRARAGEELACLDGKARRLTSDVVVVADADRAQALAGIIGGTASAVTAATTEILLEAATWEPRRTRATSRALGLRTDASSRFEKGLSPALSRPAIDRAAGLIAELGGATPAGHADVYAEPLIQSAIELRTEQIERILGIPVPLEEAAGILDRLAFRVQRSSASLRVTPPDFRLDCLIAEDLVEEIGRIHGYDRVPSTLPGARTAVRDLFRSSDVDEFAREVLAGRGIDEAITNALASAGATMEIRLPAAPAVILGLDNPMVENRRALRVSLLPGLLEAVALNSRQDQPAARLFEVGSAFWAGQGGAVDEPRLLAVAIHAPAGADAALQDLRDLQASMTLVRERVAIRPTNFAPAQAPGFHPGRTAGIVDQGGPIGIVGEVHPALLAQLGLPGRAVAAEVLFDRFVGSTTAVPQASPLPRFPGIRRDLTIVIRGPIAARDLAQVMRRLGGYTLREISMLTEYHGPQLGADARSLSFRLHYQADDRTLTSEEVSATHQTILDGLKRDFNADVRA